MSILCIDRKRFKLRLGNLGNGLQVTDKTVEYRNRCLGKSYKDHQTTESKQLSHQRKNASNTKNFGKTEKQRVEMVWTRIHGG
jgi:hypothetical protein